MTHKLDLSRLFSRIKFRPGIVFGLIIFGALFAFEIFNYSTTDYALRDLLGELRFANIRWATILAVAFCGIDFAGIARLFSPQQASQPRETWYLFGAWLLAATMNAMLTWWGVALAIANHSLQSSSVVDSDTLLKVVPVFVAVMVWIIRILIIGTISNAADHLLGSESLRSQRPVRNMATEPAAPRPAAAHILKPRPSATRTIVTSPSMPAARTEPTYHSMATRPGSQAGSAAQRQ